MDKKQWSKVSQFVSPSYLDIDPAIIILIGRIFHKNVLQFQVPVHYVYKMWGGKGCSFNTDVIYIYIYIYTISCCNQYYLSIIILRMSQMGEKGVAHCWWNH